MADAVDTVVCAPDDGWEYHTKHVEKFPDINKLCDVASCWIYEYIGILLGARPIFHISRIKVNMTRYFSRKLLGVLIRCRHEFKGTSISVTQFLQGTEYSTAVCVFVCYATTYQSAGLS
jgi:hypothetical protein